MLLRAPEGIRRTTDDAGSLVHMHDLGWRETVEERTAGSGIGLCSRRRPSREAVGPGWWCRGHHT